MRIIPAIDIRGGNCVRLLRGDYDRETVFGNDPGAMARQWIEQGARSLHIVDLDGARDGTAANRQAVNDILQTVRACQDEYGPIATDLGGGVRDIRTVAGWLDAGLNAVVLGTAAVRDPDLVSQAAQRYPGCVWVGIDARGSDVAVSGWTRSSGVDVFELARNMAGRGATGIIYTDIDRDGTGDGLNVEVTAQVADACGIPVIASGGVHAVADIERLRMVEDRGVAGVVVGRALYDGDVALGDLLAAAGD